jgi:outer membrane PBP1 activator LpoA protein
MTSKVRHHPLATALIALLVTACGSQPTPQTGQVVATPAVDATSSVTSDVDSAYTPLLNEAETLLSARQLLPAASILTQLERSKLSPNEQLRRSMLWARLHYLGGDVNTALAAIQAEEPLLANADPALRWESQRLILNLLTASGDALAAARTAANWLDNIEAADQRQYLIGSIWHRLQSASLEELKQGRQTASRYWRGWLDLALLAAHVEESPDTQVAEIQLWQQQYSDHPMAADLPGGLDMLEQLAATKPRRIALLLPLSHALANAGRAVLDGFLAAYYMAASRGWDEQQLQILDTDRYNDINAAYLAAVEAGAELVIGPLEKESLARWQQAEPPTGIPLLALNWQQERPELVNPDYQMALAPEDEARQLAQWAFDRGARQALVIRPAGSWGDEMSASLSQRWLELHGDIRASAVYTDRSDYSSSIKNALNLSESEERSRKIRRLMGMEVEFSPRRRQDIDSVFLLSGQPAEARSIKPLIDFHYAADLPVYATSHVYSGQANTQRDRDLNGVLLLQMPWVLQPGEVHQAIQLSGADAKLSAMHALGADAFLLHWRLGQLRTSPENSIRGNTGLLSMDKGGRIHRELLPASFRAGVPEPLENQNGS